MLDRPLVFLDVETTGGNAARHRVIEIGLVEVEHGRHAGEWSTLVNPERPIPFGVQALTGITEKMVAAAPTFADIAAGLHARLAGKLLVAHNAGFDYGFLRSEFRRAGLRYESRVLCTVKLSRRLFPQHARHNLDSLVARHELACEARHRALADARVLWLLMDRWRDEIAPSVVETAAADLGRAPVLPAGLPEGALEGLPEAPGVYQFYGDGDVALYVGGSVDLRSRVMGHFAAGKRPARDMKIAAAVKRVDWTETGGELSALIEEARLVRQLEPLYNRRSRGVGPAGTRHALRPWPFRGRIGVREHDAEALIVLDRWCCLGTARDDSELFELSAARASADPDPDTYRVLKRFLSRRRRGYEIVELPLRKYRDQ